jgi:all-trans-retinol 13,14-reductase
MHRGSDYEALKSAIGDVIWKQTMALFPQLKGKVAYFDVGTPVTNKYYLGASGGEMYGCDHDTRRFTPKATVELRPETPIKNLYLTGQVSFTYMCHFSQFSCTISRSLHNTTVEIMLHT